MKSTYFPAADFSSLVAMTLDQPHSAEKPAVRVKELSERDRRRLLMHFLALDDKDRLLRFGRAFSDAMITRYVQLLDFSRDTVFGVYDADLELVGVGHLVFVAKEAMPVLREATVKARIAEFGLSVSASARGIGIGSKLFERAAIRCRNEDVDTLYMHCLSSNQSMIHIAKKTGMEICRDYGGANTWLKLAPVNPGTMPGEAVEEQFSSFDYTFKANSKEGAKWWKKLPGEKGK